MELLVRTWNIFHGRTFPETGELHLEAAVRLVAEGAPDAVCLQEVPLWALSRVEGWSGMRAVAARTKRALAGPFAGPLQRLDPRRFRSPFTGQANAVLLGPRLERLSAAAHVLNPGAREERRVVQVLRLRLGPGELLLANVHASERREAALAELERLGRLLPAEGPAVVCGDLNAPGAGLEGFSDPLPGLDQILARGLSFVRGPAPWPDDRRRVGEALLSDHAPLEAEIIAS
jgi:endonuclease/exonuclease/phosphatase family metal-dependent hydrolase